MTKEELEEIRAKAEAIVKGRGGLGLGGIYLAKTAIPKLIAEVENLQGKLELAEILIETNKTIEVKELEEKLQRLGWRIFKDNKRLI